MAKATHFTGQPVFNQLLSLVPRSFIRELVKKYQADRYCKKFHTYDHLVTMLYGVLHQCSCLREVITGMQASASRLTHLGLRATPRKSTLADANERRTSQLFEDLFHMIYERYYGALPDSLSTSRWLNKLFIVDSSIISLFTTVMRSTGSFDVNGRKKGGIKAHVLMRAKDNLPCFVRLSEGKDSDTSLLPMLQLPKGSILVMDKGYRNFQQFIRFTNKGINWVTRLHERTVYETVEPLPLDSAQRESGIKADCLIHLGNPRTSYINPIQKARVVTFYDQASSREFQFLTNNFTYSATAIAEMYKKRWQIELFFKRIKQNFQLHYFLGDSENAIRIQLWCTLIADLLLKVVKDKVDKKKRWSMANLTGLVRLHLGTYINLYTFLKNPEKALVGYTHPAINNQLSLFNIKIRGA